MGMDIAIGLKTNNFTLIASDRTVSTSILSVKSDHSKFKTFKNVSYTFCGQFSTACDLSELMYQEIKLIQIRTGIEMTSKTVSNFLQNKIHHSLRTATPANCS